MFGETTIFHVKIWNHPIETTIYKWLFGVPGKNLVFEQILYNRKITPWKKKGFVVGGENVRHYKNILQLSLVVLRSMLKPFTMVLRSLRCKVKNGSTKTEAVCR